MERSAAADHSTFTLVNVMDHICDRLKCLYVRQEGQRDRNKRGRDVG